MEKVIIRASTPNKKLRLSNIIVSMNPNQINPWLKLCKIKNSLRFMVFPKKTVYVLEVDKNNSPVLLRRAGKYLDSPAHKLLGVFRLIVVLPDHLTQSAQ